MTELVHAVFDIETLGLRDDAVILSIGAAAFKFGDPVDYDKLVLDGFYAKIAIKPQLVDHKRTTTKSTIDWWKEQSADARAVLEPTPIDHSVYDACNELSQWLDKVGYNSRKSYAWSRGNHFDFPKIETLFGNAGVDLPYNNWKVRDVRTYVDIMGGKDDGYYTLEGGIPANFVAHHALHDAAHDAAKIMELYLKAVEE